MSSNKFRSRVTLLAAAFVGALVLSTGVADAHSHVTHSEPGDGDVVAAEPAQVSITFNEKVDDPQLTVTGPDGNVWSQGDVQVDGRSLSIALAPQGPAGVYTTKFVITSKDGHVVEGQRSFTVAPPADAAPAQ
ncbi:copper resistance protein CopC [Nocardia sp. NPDC059240]|uniref:copper resistance CopC family protein n=1 Tax=Nocardia sp. NPDC059240 TaxID=3346786 RepID=UPI00369F6B5F